VDNNNNNMMNYGQNNYNQNQNGPYNTNNANNTNYTYNANFAPMRVGEWLVTFLIMAIPLVNIVMMFVWAFGSNVNESKKSYFRATLIMAAIVIAIYIVLFIIFGATLLSLSRYNY
jgi:hypothetical protein